MALCYTCVPPWERGGESWGPAPGVDDAKGSGGAGSDGVPAESIAAIALAAFVVVSIVTTLIFSRKGSTSKSGADAGGLEQAHGECQLLSPRPRGPALPRLCRDEVECVMLYCALT